MALCDTREYPQGAGPRPAYHDTMRALANPPGTKEPDHGLVLQAGNGPDCHAINLRLEKGVDR